MPYGTIKVDTITFTDGGVDKSVAISGLVQNPTFSGNITATGTISGNIIQGGTTVSGLTVTGTTANFASGVFTTQISGAIVKVPAGTAGTPSLQVGTGTSVAPGLYGAGTDQIGISTGGSSVVVLDSVGQLRVVNAGTAAAPAVIVGNDLNSGLYSPGPDQLAISTGGTERMRIDSSGNLWVGKTSEASLTPISAKAVVRSGSANVLALESSVAGGPVNLDFDGLASNGLQSGPRVRLTQGHVTSWDSYFAISIGGGGLLSERLRITSTGNVGIGTSAPGTVLHCAINSSSTSIATAPGTAFFQNLNATSGAINNLLFVNSGGFGSAAIYTTQTQTGNSGDNLVFTTKSSGGSWNTGVVIDTAGNVGIGASAPGENLDVAAAEPSGNVTIRARNLSTTANSVAVMSLEGGNGAVSAQMVVDGLGSVRGLSAWNGTITNHPFLFLTNNTERLRITSDGKVGIGNTTGLGGTLGVSGHISLSGVAGASRYIGLMDETSTYTGALALQAGGGSAGFGGAITMYGHAHATYPGSVYIGTSTSSGGSIIFGTNNAINPVNEKVRISSDGKVGIGTSAPNQLLHVNQTGVVGGEYGIRVSQISATANALKLLIDSANTTSSIMQESTVPLILGTNNTERLRITSDGKVGIGTSSPRTALDLGTISSVLTIADSSTPDQGLRLGCSRRLNFGDGLVARNLVGVTGTDSLATPATGSSGYCGTEYKYGGDIFFYTSSASTTANSVVTPPVRLAITAAGNVGIGTSTPGFKLHIVGAGNAGAIRTEDTSQSAILYLNPAFNAGVPAIQTGSNHPIAFAVNDQERARFDTSGRLLMGTSSADTITHNSSAGTFDVIPTLEVTGVGATTAFIYSKRAAADDSGPQLAFARASDTGGLVPGGADTVLGAIQFFGGDGVDLRSCGGRISCEVDGTPGADDMPGRLVFATTADGAATPTEAMRINNQRELLIGTTTRTANGGVLQISNGITFPGTQSACSDPNTLDDYEEGTWTPTLSGGWSGGTVDNGTYTKIGRLCFCRCSLSALTYNGSGAFATLTLPFNGTQPTTTAAAASADVSPFNRMSINGSVCYPRSETAYLLGSTATPPTSLQLAFVYQA